MPIRDDDPRPPYLQLADDLRGRIERGDYQPGDRLPTTRQLAQEHGISTGTVQSALRVLRDEGLIVAHHGRGHFVQEPTTEPAQPDVMSMLRDIQTNLADLRETLDRVLHPKPDPDVGPDPDQGPGPEL